MWVLGQKGALGIKRLCNGHGDVTAVSTGPPPVMDLGIKRPGLLGGPVERTTHRPRFGASPSLLCSSVTKKRTKCHEAGFFFWVAEIVEAHRDPLPLRAREGARRIAQAGVHPVEREHRRRPHQKHAEAYLHLLAGQVHA